MRWRQSHRAGDMVRLLHLGRRHAGHRAGRDAQIRVVAAVMMGQTEAAHGQIGRAEAQRRRQIAGVDVLRMGQEPCTT